MTAAFDKAVAFVLAEEGPGSNDPFDKGGKTRYGIAQNRHPDIDVSSLTIDQAKAIYQSDYWDAVQGDSLPYFLALPVFDMAVSEGPRTAVRALQTALMVTMDGIVGPQTLAVAGLAPRATLDRFMAMRVTAYARNPDFTTYGVGWLRRCFAVTRAACA